jgi:hypothetical protein
VHTIPPWNRYRNPEIDLQILKVEKVWYLVHFVQSLDKTYLSMTCFMQGMSISTPSRPNLFSAVHFFARKFSKPADREILKRIDFLF